MGLLAFKTTYIRGSRYARRTYCTIVNVWFAGGGMKYALKLDQRIEATPKASAICPLNVMQAINDGKID